jgi:hypothetical protein
LMRAGTHCPPFIELFRLDTGRVCITSDGSGK